MLELRNERLRVRLAPEIGASQTDLSILRGGSWTPLMRPSPDPLERAADAASFLLVPYSNRLRDARFEFEGKFHQLRWPEKHAIHGDVRDRPWTVVRRTETSAALRLESREFPDFNFPFPIAVDLEIGLEGLLFRQRLAVRNAGRERMPAGAGFHPYFRRSLGSENENVELEFQARGVYPGETPLPTGTMVPVPADKDFGRRRTLDVALDHCFGGWDGRADLWWPASGVHARLEASPAVRHLILYSPQGQPFFALEPVTNANDGFNLAARGVAASGVVVLEPGGSLEAVFTIEIEA